jgi:hypothetical protein
VPKDELEEPFDGPGTQCDVKFEWARADGVEFGSLDVIRTATLTWASQKFLELIGYTLEELIHVPPLDIVHSVDGMKTSDLINGNIPKPAYSLPPGVTELKGTSFCALVTKERQLKRLRMRRRIEFITKNGESRPKRGYISLCEVMSSEPLADATGSESNKKDVVENSSANA